MSDTTENPTHAFSIRHEPYHPNLPASDLNPHWYWVCCGEHRITGCHTEREAQEHLDTAEDVWEIAHEQIAHERDEARANARVLAHAWSHGERPPDGPLQESFAYPEVPEP